MNEVQEIAADLAFSIVTMGYLLLKVFIAWEVLGVLIKLNKRLRWIWEEKN